MISKIYKISNPSTDKIYIGSTTMTLFNRMSRHRNNKNCSSYELARLENSKIEPLETFPYETYEKMREREQYYLNLNGGSCVNKNKAYNVFRTNKEKYKYYYENNKEGARQRMRRYLSKCNTIISCECGGHYNQIRKNAHNKTKRHINFLSNN